MIIGKTKDIHAAQSRGHYNKFVGLSDILLLATTYKNFHRQNKGKGLESSFTSQAINLQYIS